MRFSVSLATAFLVATAPIVAYAQMNAGEATSARISGFRELGTSFKNLNDQLKSGQPAKSMIRYSARQILSASKAQYGWFPAGSGPAPGSKTKAKAAIWADRATFLTLQKKFENEAALMGEAVDQGEPALMKKQAAALGGTCKSCHDKFREPS